VYPGEQAGIIPRELWDKVQERLRTNNYAHRSGSRAKEPSLLVGLVYDERGNRFTPSHTVKNGKRYRYYVSQAAIKHPGSCHQGPVRIPAGELETATGSALHSFLKSAKNVTDALALRRKNADSNQDIIRAAAALSKRLLLGSPADRRAFIRTVVARIVVRSEGLEVLVRKEALQNRIFQSPARHRDQSSEVLFSLKINTHLVVGGREVRLVLTGDCAEGIAGHPIHSLIKAVARAHDWYERIIRGELRHRRSIAKLTGLDERYVSRILRCAFLAPDIVDAILKGQQPPCITVHDLVSDLPSDWITQRQRLGFAAK
jgi:hypothetical protein